MRPSKGVLILSTVLVSLIFLFVPWIVGEALRYVVASFKGEISSSGFKSMWVLGISWMIILWPLGAILLQRRR